MQYLSFPCDDDTFCDTVLAHSYGLLAWTAAGDRVMRIFMLPKGVRKGKIGVVGREWDWS